MGSTGTVALQEIWRMLNRCAPGHQVTQTNHHWCIRYGGKTYPSLPLGDHGARKNPDIQVGHIKKMARTLDIYPCAQETLPQLR